jgi:hypothetical protein
VKDLRARANAIEARLDMYTEAEAKVLLRGLVDDRTLVMEADGRVFCRVSDGTTHPVEPPVEPPDGKR